MNEDQCSLPNEIEKKEKEKKKKKKKTVTLCLETRTRSEGVIWLKPLKPDALNLNWLGVIDLVFAIRVDGWSLASYRCLILEVIRSPG